VFGGWSRTEVQERTTGLGVDLGGRGPRPGPTSLGSREARRALGVGRPQAKSYSIHRSAWKRNSAKVVCRLMHSPARWPPYGRPETSRLLKVDHLHVCIKMHSGGCASCSQNADANTGVGVVRCFDSGSVTRGTVCLTSVCVQGDLKAAIYGQASRVVETTFFGWRGVLGALKSRGTCGSGPG
jgi:hypothetical protein